MDLNTFNKIQDTINRFNGLSKDCLEFLKFNFRKISESTLISILSFYHQEKTKRTHYRIFSKGDEVYSEYLTKIEENETNSRNTKSEPPGVICKLAIKFDTNPTLLSRIILERHCRDHFETDENSDGKIKSLVAKLLKDPCLINDQRLAYEIHLANYFDFQNGPISDCIKNSIGYEYEIKLKNILKSLKITYVDEEQLRENGFDRTPDIKLDIPIAVNDGFVISWIESKALFGQTANHDMYVKEQYTSYWNRFGPGLIIYWFGYLETIVDPKETRFLICDKFPENVIYMNPMSVLDNH